MVKGNEHPDGLPIAAATVSVIPLNENQEKTRLTCGRMAAPDCTPPSRPPVQADLP
jgi:hypothetical protein